MHGSKGFEFDGASQSFNMLVEYLSANEKMEMITPVGTRKFTSGGEKMELTTPVITTRIAVVKVKEHKKVIVKRIADQDSAEKTHLSQERPGMDSDDSYGMLDINNDLNESPPGQNGSHFERRVVPPPLPNKCVQTQQ